MPPDRHGRVRGMPHVTPSQLRVKRGASHQSQQQNQARENQQLRAEVDEMKGQVNFLMSFVQTICSERGVSMPTFPPGVSCFSYSFSIISIN